MVNIKSKVAVLVLFSVMAGCSRAAPFADFEPAFEQLSFRQPVLLTYAPGMDNRLFVVEQSGTIRTFVAEPEVDSTTVFFDMAKATDNRLLTGGEQGLLGLAFHPSFADNGWFYVNYTAAAPRRTVIARYQVQPVGTRNVDYASEQVLLEVEQDFANHNGGMVAFGPDGKLYIGMGDGGSAGDPNGRAQDGQALLGKMLRLNDDGTIPDDNPFVDDSSVRDEIWAIGLRNPWRFSFDRTAGTLWAADVGQSSVEEINRIERGKNYGWRWFEGSESYRPDAQADKTDTQKPVFEYSHDLGKSVTGGVVYRGQEFPGLTGWYLFADFVSGRAWALNTETGSVEPLAEVPNPSSFGEDAEGEVYVTSYRGQLYRLVDPSGP